MGVDELTAYLGPVLSEKGKGFVSWGLLPSYPTLKSYIELLLDTPEFFVMFWNSVKIVFFSVAGQLLFGIPAAWGFARYKFPFKKVPAEAATASVRSTRTTVAPCWARTFAQPKPMPWAAPVTIAIFPSRFPIFLFSFMHCLNELRMSSLYAVIIKARSGFVTNQAQKIRTTKILFWQNGCILCTFWEMHLGKKR